MTYTIAVAGKGGTGKTTLCGFMIDYLCKTNKTPVLAVDADANSNLNEVLGVEVEQTLGDIREEVARAELAVVSPIPAGMSKMDYMNMKFSQALIEDDDFDMLVMGKTQGEGCYCYVNGVLKTQIQRLVGNYKTMVVDNEAGMEHIARGILPKIDTLFLISDCSRRGIQAVGRIAELVDNVNIKAKNVKLIVNRAPNGELTQGVLDEIAKYNLDLAGVVPQDDMIFEADGEGVPTASLSDETPSKKALWEIMGKLGI